MQTRQLLLQPHQWGLNQILKQVKIVPFCLLPAAPWEPRLPGNTAAFVDLLLTKRNWIRKETYGLPWWLRQ